MWVKRVLMMVVCVCVGARGVSVTVTQGEWFC